MEGNELIRQIIHLNKNVNKVEGNYDYKRNINYASSKLKNLLLDAAQYEEDLNKV